MVQVTARLRQHWFYALIPLWLAASLNFQSAHDWQARPQLGEAVALFDWCLFVPALYVLCYRKSRPAKAVAIRVLALTCAGIWVAGHMVPDPAQILLRDWAWLRGVGIAGLLLLETGAIIAMLRVAFSKDPTPQALTDRGVPPILARMMLAEARFWRWLFSRRRE
ncbi:hypothetical protein LQ953_01180 [Sphingomonas sp. IC-56]|uniref:hypothetical protein n=1 Tax=Sphingomonas sp. IC-56 TaxID=2898529 RepID=UPI001E4D457B|nr:hypothetical protein [Sphingomonas sp. IC-56]MCD2322624.1 hypothetical protein [Sphingomonas sp. IC-56]